MYRIVVGDETLWTPTLENNNYLITDPTLTLESNKPSTLNFTVPNISAKKDIIELIRPEIKAYDNDRRIFRGRVLTNGKDFKRNRSIYCEGELAYLRDVIVRPTWTLGTKSVATYFEDMIAHYNATMNGISDYKKFVFGSCTVTGESIERKNDQYPDMLSELTDKLLNKYGGYFVITVDIVNGEEVTYISYLEDPGNDDSVTIQYGKNLLDLTESKDATPVYTRIIPLGAQVNNNRITIDGLSITAPQSEITKYGLIEHVETYDQIKNKSDLEDAGQETLDHVAVSDSLEITALNSRMPDGSYGVLDCGKKYRILSAPHGYVDEDDRGRLNRQELKLAKPLESRYTFGKVKTGITQEAVSTNRTVDQVVKLAQMTSGDVAELKEKMASIADFVTENSTSGAFSWSKWNSGKLELRASNLQCSPTRGGTWTSEITYYYFDVSLPISFIDTNYTVSAVRSSGATFAVIGVAHNSTNSLRVALVIPTPSSDPANLYVDLIITGKWK